MAEIDLSIFSMNCNVLSDNLKRIAVFSKLKKKTNGIIMLQETHSTPEMEQRWQNDWRNKQMYFSHGASNSKGVAIIITNNYDANIVNIRRDTNGRMILLDIERNGTIYTVGNIYTPTRNFEQDQRLVFIRPFEKRTYYAMAMSVRLSVRPSVRPSFPDFFSTCFDISNWNLVYAFSRWHDMSSLSFITIGSLWPSLQPNVGQTQFLQSWPYKSR